jgi:phage tail-like protein
VADFSDPATSVHFKVEIDQHQLGMFSTCDGLGCEVAIEQREEGGNNFYVHQLPGRIKYTNIKLTRPLTKDSHQLADWFASMATGVERTNGRIVALTPRGETVVEWNLRDVIPVKWTGPQFSVESPKVAMETLELAHHGFLKKHGG